MNPAERANASAEIQKIFASYRTAQTTDAGMLAALADGKLYELYVLSQLVIDLDRRGFRLRFVGSTPPPGATGVGHSTLKFKASPGMIKMTDSHFEVICPASGSPICYLFANIEFDTLGHAKTAASDYSRRHELDLILTWASSGYPAHSDIALAVECKAVANFEKGLVKEALGVRRELSILASDMDTIPTRLGATPAVQVPAIPPSEFILAFIDPKGQNYEESPRAFGITFEHHQP